MANNLVNWYLRHRRSLPWRPQDPHTPKRDAYRVWISEIMLQQTQVEAVKNHYLRWMERFPDVYTLAQTADAEVLNHWQGLGYYSRARNILRTARLICAEYNGEFPLTRALLEKLPGVGPYTAGAILSLAMGQSEPILDGNLVRIFSRTQGWDFLPDTAQNRAQYWDLATTWCHAGPANLVNEALMELGALVCTPTRPDCTDCPLQTRCAVACSADWQRYPPRKKLQSSPWFGMALIITNRHGDLWCMRDPQSFFLKNQCNFPLLPMNTLDQIMYNKIALFMDIPVDWVQNNLQKSSLILRHAITRFRLQVHIAKIFWDGPLNIEGSWIPSKEIPNHIAHSLGLKIWNAQKSLRIPQ